MESRKPSEEPAITPQKAQQGNPNFDFHESQQSLVKQSAGRPIEVSTGDDPTYIRITAKQLKRSTGTANTAETKLVHNAGARNPQNYSANHSSKDCNNRRAHETGAVPKYEKNLHELSQ